MNIGLAQLNTTVGDLEGNRSKMVAAYHHLVETGAELVVFPELVTCGYPPRDLLFKSRFVPDTLESLHTFARETGVVPAVVGVVDHNPHSPGRPFLNTAVCCQQGSVTHRAVKCLLPTYDVFDEDRYFEPAYQPSIWDINGRRIGITICEDIWIHPELNSSRTYDRDPVAHLAGEHPDLVLNLSASPWHSGKEAVREELVSEAARRCQCPVVYCNAVGGNDELIFDGRSLVANGNGMITHGLASFEECILTVDTDSAATTFHPTFRQDTMANIYAALTLGLRDYGRKCGFDQVLLGLSGGIDSSVTACLAVAAFGPENVLGISNPSAISSEHSRGDARQLAENLGIHMETLPIAPLVDAAEATLSGLFAGTEPGIAEENIQARSRGLLWMGISNKFGRLLLTCGNKSELAVGYCTLYGDMCGGLAVISDLPKTQVYALARWINRDREIIPQNVITKPPSAELRPDQTDQDSLPDYAVLDAILERYVEQGRSSEEIIADGFEPEVVRDVIRKVDLNEYKRKQAAPGLKITPLAFGVGRRIPIVQRYVS